ncbi:MAG: hypothetical protein AB8F65_14265 [Woeseiaceae bacterium]
MFKKLIVSAILIVVVGYFGAKFYIQYKAKEVVDQVIAGIPGGVSVNYDSVTSTASGELSVDDIVVQLPEYRDEFLIDAIGLDFPSFFDVLGLQKLPSKIMSGSAEVPEKLGFFIEGFQLDTNADYVTAWTQQWNTLMAESGQSTPTLEEDPVMHCLGKFSGINMINALGKSTLDVSLGYDFEQLENSFQVGFDFNMEDIYEMTVTMELEGRAAYLIGNPNPRLVLVGFEMLWVDRAYMDAVYKQCEQLGVDRDTAKAGYLSAFLSTLEASSFVPDERLIDPIRKGIEAEHRTWRVVGEPPSPVDLAQIRFHKPEDMPALLGVDVESQ